MVRRFSYPLVLELVVYRTTHYCQSSFFNQTLRFWNNLLALVFPVVLDVFTFKSNAQKHWFILLYLQSFLPTLHFSHPQTLFKNHISSFVLYKIMFGFNLQRFLKQKFQVGVYILSWGLKTKLVSERDSFTKASISNNLVLNSTLQPCVGVFDFLQLLYDNS